MENNLDYLSFGGIIVIVVYAIINTIRRIKKSSCIKKNDTYRIQFDNINSPLLKNSSSSSSLLNEF